MREIFSLDGIWNWQVKDGIKKMKLVPSSYNCVGDAVYEKEIDIHILDNKRVFIIFEGVAYQGVVWLNGIELGVMQPYSEYRFELTDIAKSGINLITVDVSDYNAAFGSFEGWEDYGGLIRSVFLEYTDIAYICDFDFVSALKDNYTAADCIVNIITDGTGADKISYNLSFNNVTVSESYSVLTKNKTEFLLTVNNPCLWSPEFPNLYQLELTLYRNGYAADKLRKQVGIREFKAQGTRFYLNGADIFLKGVCRHEMWGEQGFTVTEDQTAFDFKLMKQLGANYCRLVHYPHCKKTIELADKMGIMVSEEPGLWGWGNELDSDLIRPRAREVMKKTVLRDKNNPSVIFWLVSNECKFTEKYTAQTAAMIKTLDPSGRLVSAASLPNPEGGKQVFKDCGLDFYTQHIYCYDPWDTAYTFEKAAAEFCDKPIIFTEWGANLLMGNGYEWKRFAECLRKLARSRSPEPNIAGLSWWSWSDVYQWKRGGMSCIDGVLTSGVVDSIRNIKPDFLDLLKLYNALDSDLGDHAVIPEIEIVGSVRTARTHTYKPIDLTSYINTEGQTRSWDDEISKVIFPWMPARKATGALMPYQVVEAGNLPVLLQKGRPVLLSPKNRTINIKIAKKVKTVHFLGNITFNEGYPITGEYGSTAAEYTFIYDSGITETYQLLNGIDICSSALLHKVTRIDSRVSDADRLIKLIIDTNFEIYQINHRSIAANEDDILKEIIFESCNDCLPMLYGITLEL